MRKLIRIELLSDLCVSSGDIYNSSIDTDVCYDKYGLPYIPSKRIKGCLREAAIELKDWGLDIDIDRIFGKSGNSKGLINISNANIENYDKYVEEIESNKNHSFMHQQVILSQFTSVRTQTAMDYEKGIFEPHSLRTMRVVNSGNVFYAPIEIYELKEVTDLNDKIECICKALRYMGNNRTRGLGHVLVSLEDSKNNKDEVIDSHIDFSVDNNESDMSRIEYRIVLKSPVICKSIDNDQEKTDDYISGSKILGMIARTLKKYQKDIDVSEFFDTTDILCSNAYICKNISKENIRFLPVPASLYKVKNNNDCAKNKAVIKEFDVEEKDKNNNTLQLNQSKGYYVNSNIGKNIYKLTVDTEQHYHHSRPVDKSIGHVDESDGTSQFYQMESISSGQQFAGYIEGKTSALEKLKDKMNDGEFRIGYNNSSEYGLVKFVVDSFENIEKKKQEIECSRFAVKLEAPVIEYNDNGMYEANKDILIDEIGEKLHIKNLRDYLEASYVQYSVVGGYNVTWGCRKPTITTLDKGTVLIFDLKNEKIKISNMHYHFGERCSEGYGEISIYQVKEDKSQYDVTFISEDKDKNENGKEFNISSLLGEKIVISKYLKFVENEARNQARNFAKEQKDIKDYKPVIANMTIMIKEEDSIEELRETIRKRYDKGISETKQNKKERAFNIVNTYDKVSYITGNEKEKLAFKFTQKYKICNDDMKKILNDTSLELEMLEYKKYISSYINELKYYIKEIEKTSEKDIKKGAK